ncbi:MAG TPA: hypothetical protein VFG23_23400, partial [Polyangia bacterium]|nr:hypothetical protein [Polyangia bacterium]
MKSRARGRTTALVVALGLAAGCATAPPRAARPPVPDVGLLGWQALAEGRGGEAGRLFESALAGAPSSASAVLSRFGRATLSYERGESGRALEDYAALLLALPAVTDRPLRQALAPVAAARVLALYDEVGFAAQVQIAQRLQPVELARSPELPWLARVELARLGDHIARQAADADALARVAAEDGCASVMFEVGSLGPFPHLDLDRPATEAKILPERAWRPLSASGCHLDAPLTADGRGEARILRAAVEVGAGAYDIVLELDGEARLSVDGGPWVSHGRATGYGPRFSASRVVLGAGRHQLTVRTASNAGQTRLGLWVLPGAAGSPARFVDPRAAGAPVAGAPGPVAPSAVRAADLETAGVGGRALAAYCAAFAADRMGAIDGLAVALERLQAWPRFAAGLSLVGEIARHDPTRPATFARDAARRSLRAAVGADETLARAWQSLAEVELEDDRPRDAIDDARRALHAAPAWWPPELLLARALAARGLDVDADRALAEVAQRTGVEAALSAGASPSSAPCAVIEALRGQARERQQIARGDQLSVALRGCGGDLDVRVDRARARGETAEAIALLRAALRIDPDRDDLAADLALMLAESGPTGQDLNELAALV